MFLKVDDSVSVNDIDLSLYIPRDVDETGITVVSLERFSTYTSEKDENLLSEASRGRAENGERSDLEEDKEGGGQGRGRRRANGGKPGATLLSPRTPTSPSAWWGEGKELRRGMGKEKEAKVEV